MGRVLPAERHREQSHRTRLRLPGPAEGLGRRTGDLARRLDDDQLRQTAGTVVFAGALQRKQCGH